jgi:hypothetical protein
LARFLRRKRLNAARAVRNSLVIKVVKVAKKLGIREFSCEVRDENDKEFISFYLSWGI